MFDFINSNQFHDNSDAWSKNEHRRNYLAVEKLLLENEKLVVSYFSKKSISESDIEELLNLFYSGITTSTNVTNSPNPMENVELNDLANNIPNQEDLVSELIVVVANEINLFKEHLNHTDAMTLLGHEKIRNLTATNNSRLVLFFDKLSSMNLINETWQVDIARRQLIISSSGKKFLTQHDLSASLYRIKERKTMKKEVDIINLIDTLYLQLEEKISTKGNF